MSGLSWSYGLLTDSLSCCCCQVANVQGSCCDESHLFTQLGLSRHTLMPHSHATLSRHTLPPHSHATVSSMLQYDTMCLCKTYMLHKTVASSQEEVSVLPGWGSWAGQQKEPHWMKAANQKAQRYSAAVSVCAQLAPGRKCICLC